MDECFQHIWNQLILVNQFEIYGDISAIFRQLEGQTVIGKAEGKLTNRQFLVLINAINEWRDILAKQSRAKGAGEDGQSASENADSGEQE